MKTQSNIQNSPLNFNYQALDKFLSTEIDPQELQRTLEEIEVELLTSPADYVGSELIVDDMVWQFLKLVRELTPISN